jgi:hypothetical protein
MKKNYNSNFGTKKNLLLSVILTFLITELIKVQLFFDLANITGKLPTNYNKLKTKKMKQSNTYEFSKIICLLLFISALSVNLFSQCSSVIAGGQAGRTLMVQVSPIGPLYTYQWSNSGGPIPGATSAFLISSLLPDCYSVVVTNTNTSATCSATKCTQHSVHHVMSVNINGNINSGNYMGSGVVNYDLSGISNVPSIFSANLNFTNVPSGWSPSLTLLNSLFTCYYNNADDTKPIKPLNYYSVAGDSITLNRTITLKNSSNVTLGVIQVTGILVSHNIDSSSFNLNFQGNYSGPINIDSIAVSSANIQQVGVGEIQESFSQTNYLTFGSPVTAYTQTTYYYNTSLQLPGDEISLRTITSFSLGNPILATGTAYYILKSNNIPTLSQWGLTLLLLLLITFGTVFIIKRQRSMAIAGGIESSSLSGRSLFNRILYFKVLAVVLLILSAVISFVVINYGSVSKTDVVGGFLSSLIIAYLIHLIPFRKKE